MPLPVRLGALVLLSALAAGPAQAATFVVNSTGDAGDALPGDGLCATAGAVCTLRAAIQEANALAGADTINFNIGAGGVQTITLTAALSFISQPVTIDGTTQPLYPGTPIIELSAAACGGVAALDLRDGSSGSTIRGLVINRCAGSRAIRLLGTSNNVIAGNFLGTNVAGTAALANNTGVYIGGSATASNNNRIGGTTAADRNVISGNTADGVQINGGTGGAANNRIEGNYIGLDVSGALPLGNGGQGVGVFGANPNTNNVIGGTVVSGAGNVISGNGNDGVLIASLGTTGTLVQGNFIGTNAAGSAAISNLRGVEFDAAAGGSTIGGAGAGNRIAFNTNGGVETTGTAGTGNRISSNQIYSNGTRGIDLGENGVSANDAGDGDTGPNNLQNFPVLSAAMTNGAGSATFAGSLNSAASTTYSVEFFASSAADPTGFGEGQRFLASANVTTNAAGNAIIGVTLATSLTAGEFVTATATDPSNNTSEFSAAIVAVGSLVVTTTADIVDGNTTSVSTLIATPGADGRISLREAILATNATGGADTIRFGIPLTDANHRYYRNDAIAGSLTTVQVTTLADSASPSSPAITDFDADYPAGFTRSWYRIWPTAALPNVTGAVVIDAETQPGFIVGAPVIELDGFLAVAGSGLSLATGPSTVRGLVVNRFQDDGLSLRGSGGFTITGNYLGTDVSGTKGAGSVTGSGVFITNLSGAPSTIGGSTVATRNVISANGWNGIYVYNYYAPANSVPVRIRGNFIGTDVTGTVGLGVQARGIVLEYTGGHLIGGSGVGEGNLISGNAGPGIDLNGNYDTGGGAGAPTDNNVIEANRIGTNAAGTAALPNAGHAIQMYGTIDANSSASGNTIRGNVIAASTAGGHGVLVAGNADNNLFDANFIGTDSGGTLDLGNAGSGIHIETAGAFLPTGNKIQNNTIRFNGLDGVRILGTGASATLTQNAISSDDALGIDLGGDGVTVNDVNVLDADTGANELMNFPTFAPPVEAVPGTLTVNYGLDLAAGWYRIEFFKNPSGADLSGYGEGELFASSLVVNHPGGRVGYAHSFAGNAGNVITATTTACTDGAACANPGSTSEFSRALAAATTAVELMSFTAVAQDRAVDLLWQTGSELGNLGFHLYRSSSSTGPWRRLTSSLIPGLGSSPLGKSYSWRDSGLVNGERYYYRLEDVDTASVSTFHGPVWAVPSPPGEDDGSGGGDGTERRSASCPSWVLSAAPDVPSPVCTRHGDPDATSLEILARSASSATVELRTGGFWALRDAAGRVRVFVPGFDFAQDPRAAALPFRRALVDAVVGRRVQLGGVRALDQVAFKGLVPASLGQAEMQVSRDGTARASRRALPDSSPRHLSRDLARLLPSVFQGETKSAVVEIAPLRYDARRRQTVLAKRLRVKLLFTGRETGESGRGSFGRRQRPEKAATRELLARLYTTGLGLHAVSFEQLFPGRSRGVSVSELRLERQGQARAFHVARASSPAGGEDFFGPGGVLYFLADAVASSTEFSSETAWELLRAKGGVRMPLLSAAPSGDAVTTASTARASFEVNRYYQPGLLEAEDLWQWDGLASGTTRAKGFSLTGVAATAGASGPVAELDVYLQGASESGNPIDHHVSVSVNGVPVGEAQFAGKKPYRMSLSVPPALLREGANELQLTNVGDTGASSYVFLDRFTLAHPQLSSLAGGRFAGEWPESGSVGLSVPGPVSPVVIVDVTGPWVPGESGSAATGTSSASAGPFWLTGLEVTPGTLRFRAEAGHRYWAGSESALKSPRVSQPEPSGLKSASNQADWLLITPRAFLGAADPLVALRADQGLTTRAVAFEEIAAEFGHGQPSAEAIRGFVAYAYQSWARPSPRYVLLLGDSSYDPRNFTGTSQPSPLPALFTKTSYLWTASDPQLGAVNGEDGLPDLAIGRLPATTLEQAQALVAKLIAWEESGQGLSGRAALVADNPDLAGDFEANVREVAQSYLAGRSELLLLSEQGAGLRERIRAALDSGLSYLDYVGHGGAAVWASENVWNSWDAANLLAQSQQPLLLTLNCLNGYFVAPAFDSLSESLVKVEGRGAIAAFSPSGLSLDGPAHQYHRALLAELVRGAHPRLGDALLAAQRSYAETGLMPELLVVYQLLGDPAMRIR